MSPIRPILRLAAVAAISVALSGCITLFPKAKPVQLYRFGVTAPPTQTAATAGPAFEVLRLPTSFQRAASTDGILTITGEQAAYIAGGRWVSPATVLFDEAEARAFEAVGGPARLITRGSIAKADVSLRLDVEAFEARYESGAASAPVVVVQIHAVLMRSLDRKVLGDQLFSVRKQAPDNRLGAIVPAYDAATDEALGKIVSWTNELGASSAAQTPK